MSGAARLAVTCPHCAAAPGVPCSGPGVVGGAHARRKDLARSIGMAAGMFGPAGSIACPRCGAGPGADCLTPSRRARRAGVQPLFHDERIDTAEKAEAAAIQKRNEAARADAKRFLEEREARRA